MYKVVLSKTFQKSLKRLQKSGKLADKALEKLESAIDTLSKGESLPRTYYDHKLKGDLGEHRECHIKGDLVFVYRKRDDLLILLAVDIGTHAQIFG